MTINLTLAPSGNWKHVNLAFSMLPDWPRTHLIGHGGQFGGWKPDRPKALWPSVDQHLRAPDSGFFFDNPDSWWNRGRWARHAQYVAEDVRKWAERMSPKAGERITFNAEIWSAYHEGNGKWYEGRTEARHHAYLDAIFRRTKKAASLDMPAVVRPTEVAEDASGGFTITVKFHGPDFGCSGPFRIRDYTDDQIRHMAETSPTLGMDYDSPQLYWDIQRSVPDGVTWLRQLGAAPKSLPRIPIISPFTSKSKHTDHIDDKQLEIYAKFLADRGITTADVFLNVSHTTIEAAQQHIESAMPRLERMREIFQ